MRRRFFAALLLIYFKELKVENRRIAVATFVRRYFAPVLCMLGCLLLAVASFGQAIAFTTAPGYAATDFATGSLTRALEALDRLALLLTRRAIFSSGTISPASYTSSARRVVLLLRPPS